MRNNPAASKPAAEPSPAVEEVTSKEPAAVQVDKPSCKKGSVAAATADGKDPTVAALEMKMEQVIEEQDRLKKIAEERFCRYFHIQHRYPIAINHIARIT